MRDKINLKALKSYLFLVLRLKHWSNTTYATKVTLHIQYFSRLFSQSTKVMSCYLFSLFSQLSQFIQFIPIYYLSFTIFHFNSYEKEL